MDLLDNITDGLRGDSEHGRRESRTAERSPSDRGSPESATDPTSGDADSTSDEPTADEPARDDEHVCSFCQTEFDASRGACPDCDAEIVLRGAR